MYGIDLLACDLGYDSLKFIASNKHKDAVLSVVAPIYLDTVGDSYGTNAGYKIEIRHHLNSGESAKLWLVGEAASYAANAVYTLDDERPGWFNEILLLAATAISGIETASCALAVGLPLSLYRNQCQGLQQQLMSIVATVTVLSAEIDHPKRVSYGSVFVYPQGVGAIASRDEAPEDGIYILIDVGKGTTEILVFKVTGGKFQKIEKYCKSLKVGTFLVHEAIQAIYEKETGIPLSPVHAYTLLDLLQKGKPPTHDGQPVLIPYAEIVEDVGHTLTTQIQAFLGDMKRRATTVDFGGGGALMFVKPLQKLFPIGRLLPDPVYANAIGFYRQMVRELKAKGILR